MTYPDGTVAKDKAGTVTHIVKDGEWYEVDANTESAGDFAVGLGRSFLGQGTMMGLGDEAEAGVRSLFGDRSYTDLRDEIRAENKAWSDRNKALSIASEIGGGFLTGGLGGARALAAKGLSAGAKALRSAGVGGATGTTAGLGYSEADLTKGEYGSAALDTGAGTAFGLTLGAGMPFLAKAGQTRPMQALKAALIPRSGIRQAKGKVMEALAMDARAQGISPEQLLAKLDDMPDSAFIGDLGENLRGLVSGITNIKGVAKEAGQKLLRERAAGRGERMLRNASDDLDSFGESGADVLESIVRMRKTQGGKFYEAAKAEGTQVNVHSVKKELESLAAKAAGPNKSVYNKALSYLYSGTGKKRVLKTDLEELHEAKVAIDTLLKRGRSGSTALVTPVQANLMRVQESLVNKLTGASKNYKKGWEIYTDDWRSQKALEKGASIFSKKKVLEVDPFGSLESMSKVEKDLYRLGIFAAIEDMIEGSAHGVTRVRTMLKTKAIRRRIRAAFDDDAEWQKFSDTLDNEVKMMATENISLHGSRTTPLAESVRNITGPIDVGVNLARGAAGDVMAGARAAMGARGLLTAPASKVSEKMLPYLMNPNNPQARGLLNQQLAKSGGSRGIGIATGVLGSQMSPGVTGPLLGSMF